MSRVIPQAKVETGVPAFANNTWSGLQLDAAGRLQVTGGAGGVTTVAGNHTPTDNYANPTDAVDSLSFTMGWDGATWDRIKTVDATAEPTPATAGAGLFTVADVRGSDGVFLRHFSVGLLTDAFDMTNLFSLRTAAGLMGYNGASFDRVRSLAAGDAVANPTIGALSTLGFNMLYDGALWERARSQLLGSTQLVITEEAQQTKAQICGYDETRTQVHPVLISPDNILRSLPAVPRAGDVAGYSPIPFFQHHTAAGPYEGNITGGAGRLLSLKATVRGVGAILTYFQLHDTAGAIPGANVPIHSFEVNLAALASAEVDLVDFCTTMGIFFAASCVYGLSSTPDTYTATAAGPLLTVNAVRARA